MVKVGVIGVGDWGRNHLRAYSKLGCELVGIADTDREVEKIARESGVKFFTDYRKLLKEVDAVSVVAPTHLHYKMVKEVLSAGRHVLVEKPITLDSGRTLELLEMAASKRLLLRIGYLYRFNAAVIELKRMLKDIGDIHYITCRYIHSSKPPRRDSGAIFNFAIHMFDTITFLLGRMPASIYAKKIHYLSKEREDAAVVILDYKDFFLTLEVSWLHPLKKRDMWIIASKEKIYADLLEQSVRRYPKVISYGRIFEKPPVDEEIRKNEPLLEELKSFVKRVDGWRKAPTVSGIEKSDYEEDYAAALMCELALRSAEAEEKIELELVKGRRWQRIETQR